MLSPEIRVVMPSRGRADTITRDSLRLFPYATVTVDEREMNDYLRVIGEEQLLPHPELPGLWAIHNWIFDNVDSEFTWIVFDDLASIRCLVGWRQRVYRDPELVATLLESTSFCARDAGAYLFGFGHHQGNHLYPPSRPFRVTGYVRNVMGFRRGHGLRADEHAALHADVDLALQSLVRHRIIWRDDRFVFDDALLGSNKGGQVGKRTAETMEACDAYLLKKWGPWVRIAKRRPAMKGRYPHTTATIVRVPRRQAGVRSDTDTER